QGSDLVAGLIFKKQDDPESWLACSLASGENMDLQLSIGRAHNPRTRAIFERKVKPDGIELICTAVHPSELFWRQLRFGDFDISEMSLSALMMAVASGDKRWVGIPVFTTRRMFQVGILVRK